MASKTIKSVLPDFTWVQNADEVHILFNIINPEHVLVEIDTENVFLKCTGGKKEKQLYAITLSHLFKDIDKNKSGYNVLSDVVIVMLVKVEKVPWPFLTKDGCIPVTLKPEQVSAIIQLHTHENVKLNIKLTNLKQQLKKKNKELKLFEKELDEKDQKIKALERATSDKDKKLKVIEEILKTIFDKNTEEENEADIKSGSPNSKLEELKENKQSENLNIKQETEEKDTDTSQINPKEKEVGIIEGREQSTKKLDLKLNENLSDKEEKENRESKENLNSKQAQDVSIESQDRNSSNGDTKEQVEATDESAKVHEESPTFATKPLVTLSGEMKRFIHADTPAIFKITVNDPSVRIEDIEANVKTPSGLQITTYVFLGMANRIYNIKVTPTQIGLHEIEVFVKKEFALSFLAEVYDTKRIKIEKRRYGTVERPVTFQVDVSKAGKGDLSVTIFHDTLSIKSTVEKLSGTVYIITFTPHFAGVYEVAVMYNDRVIKNTSNHTFYIKIFPPCAPIFVDFLNGNNIQINNRYQIFIMREFFNLSDFNINVIVKSPSGNIATCPLKRIDLFLFVGVFAATEIGVYKINVKLNDEHVINSPYHVRVSYDNYKDFPDNFVLYVDKSLNFVDDDYKIMEYLEKVNVNEKRSFFIDFSGVKCDGNFEIDVLITDPEKQKVPVSITGRGSSFLVEFTLNIRGNHMLKVTYNNEIVKGTPVIIKAIDDYDLLD